MNLWINTTVTATKMTQHDLACDPGVIEVCSSNPFLEKEFYMVEADYVETNHIEPIVNIILEVCNGDWNKVGSFFNGSVCHEWRTIANNITYQQAQKIVNRVNEESLKPLKVRVQATKAVMV
jgi:hypothetical protein